jgi:DNA invertase Pin-like site-specific DNA recombinase
MSMAAAKASAVSYCRASTARQASEGESLDVQRRQIEGYAHMHGLALRGVTVEEGVSGSIPVHERPKGGPLFAKLRKGDVVIAPKLDRLFRSALGNGLSKLFLTIAAAFAEAERDLPVSGLRRSRLTSEHGAAISAASCRSVIVVASMASSRQHKAEQAAIRQMAALRAPGKALRAIAEAMQADASRSATRV